jgi:ATP-dependent DNA helicase RecG
MLHVEYSPIPIDILEEMIALGEGYKTEFQDTTPRKMDLAQTVCAFTNSHGGSIFLGISKSGTPIGIGKKYEQVAKIEEAVKLLEPQPNLIVQSHDFRGKEIIHIKVQEGTERPCFVRQSGVKTAYVRKGEVNAKATKKDLKRL